MPNGQYLKDVKPGIQVKVVQKHHQRTGELTEGTVGKLLTKSAFHPHGIKVRLQSGIVGRVKEIIE
ncbi:MAG: YwbE family protein [Cyclobacteriaceae bacterium]